MTGAQQKIHKYTWLVLGLALPLIVVLSLRGLSFSENKAQFILPAAFEDKINVVEKDWITATVTEHNDKRILLLYLQKPLRHPTILVYTLKNDDQKDRLLGQIQGTGEYRFTLTQAAEGIVLFDGLKGNVIDKIDIRWD